MDFGIVWLKINHLKKDMTAFLKISTWAWIAGVFIVIKCIFKYLAFLFYDKDKTLRDAVRLAWDYLSKHRLAVPSSVNCCHFNFKSTITGAIA